jgi:hypothetical protein
MNKNISIRNLFKKDSLLVLTYIFTPGILILAITVFITKSNNIRFEMVSRDPVQIFKGKPYIGILSNMGILLWCATSTIILYSSLICRILKRSPTETNFLFFSGLLSIFLMIDDLFLLHDVIFPKYLMINQKLFYLVYGFSVIAIFIRYYRIMLNTDYVLLMIAFILLGLSAITDVLLAMGLHFKHEYGYEDSFKFLGIIAWFSYFSRTAFKFVKKAVSD